MNEIPDYLGLEMQILVAFSHLSPESGLTYKKNEADSFVISEKGEMFLSSDSPGGITKSMGVALVGFAYPIARLDPDLMLVIGYEYEALTVAQDMTAKFLIAYLHGGETSEGAIDQSIRHAITKMASYYFVAAEAYRQRAIQMGENPYFCWNVAAPDLDQKTSFSPEELNRLLKVSERPNRQSATADNYPQRLKCRTLRSPSEALSPPAHFAAGEDFTLQNLCIMRRRPGIPHLKRCNILCGSTEKMYKTGDIIEI